MWGIDAETTVVPAKGSYGERGHKVGKQVSFVVNVSGTVLKFWPGSRDIKQFDNLDFPRPARIS